MTNEFPVTHNESRKPEGKRRVEQRAVHVLMLQHHLLGSNWIASGIILLFFPPLTGYSKHVTWLLGRDGDVRVSVIGELDEFRSSRILQNLLNSR